MCIRDRGELEAPLLPTLVGVLVRRSRKNGRDRTEYFLTPYGGITAHVVENGRLYEKPAADGGRLAACDDAPAFGPVSYTHLDVYKRQGVGKSALLYAEMRVRDRKV